MEIKDIGKGVVLTRVPRGFEKEFEGLFNSIVDDFVALQSKNPLLECEKIRSGIKHIKGWRVNKSGEIKKVR